MVINIGLIVFLSIIDALSAGNHPYADLIIWIVLPAIVLLGVILIIVGIRRQQRSKDLAGGPEERLFPVIDFNDPKLRKKGLVLLMSLLLLSLLYAFSGYKAYEFSNQIRSAEAATASWGLNPLQRLLGPRQALLHQLPRGPGQVFFAAPI